MVATPTHSKKQEIIKHI